MTPRKPVRVRKARRAGTCPDCRRHIQVGDLIASIGGAPFICVTHITGNTPTERRYAHGRPANPTHPQLCDLRKRGSV